jgi:CHAT domain-containing protein/Tfp pilus assembly protein PilF
MLQSSRGFQRLHCRIVSLAILLGLLPSLALALAFVDVRSQEAKPDAGKPVANATDIRKLEAGKPIEREMKGGEEHAYEIRLEAGQFLNAVVEQRGIDVVVLVIGPDGKPLLEVDSPNGTEGPEPVRLVADAAGMYRLQVKSFDKEAPVGKYEVRINQLRAATEQDRLLQEATGLTNKVTALWAKGKYDEALPLAERALKLQEAALGPDHLELALALDLLGGRYEFRGDFAKAELLMQRSLAIREKAFGPDHLDVATSLDSLGGVYLEKGDFASAEPLLQRALTIREKELGPNHPVVAITLDNMGALYRGRRDYNKAESVLQRALAIREKAYGPDSPAVAETLRSLGMSYRQKGDYSQAEPFYQRSLAIYEKVLGPDHPEVGNMLVNLGELYKVEGDYARAEPLLERALTLFEKALGPYHTAIASVFDILTLVYEGAGNIAKAVASQRRAGDVRELDISLNLATGSERQKLIYLATLSYEIDQAVALHLRSAPQDISASRLALTTVLRRKGRALDAMAESIATLRQHLNPEQQALLDRLNAVRAQLASLTLTGPGSRGAKPYQTEVEALEGQVEKLEAQISQQSLEFRAQSQPVTVEAVQAVIPAGAALVEYVSYQPYNFKTNSSDRLHYAAYVLGSRGQPTAVDLGDAEEIDASINDLRAVLRKDEDKPLSSLDREVRPLARKVNALVMQPVRRLLSHQRHLFISPDGLLNLIPFAALVDESGQYLVKRYHFTYLTSGRDLLRLQDHLPSKQGMMIIADPDYGPMSEAATGRGLKSFKPQIIATGKAAAATKDEAAPASAIDFSQVEFPPLAGTEQESRTLKAVMPEATVMMREQATKAAIKQLAAPSILHVATHGFFLEDLATASVPEERGLSVGGQRDASARHLENPLLKSGLAMAGANLHKSGEDNGILTALEVSGLNLWGTKLVVLSACETGLGEVQTGNGIFGLRRALVLAGAESQMLSLWKVDDAATRDLMIDYYTRLKAGAGRSAALRQVQLRMLANPRYQHPYFWASFIESGEWASLDGKR